MHCTLKNAKNLAKNEEKPCPEILPAKNWLKGKWRFFFSHFFPRLS